MILLLFSSLYGQFAGAAERVWTAIVSGDALNDPTLLNTVLVSTFANLKSYRVTYWFAIPALRMASDVHKPSGAQHYFFFKKKELRFSYFYIL